MAAEAAPKPPDAEPAIALEGVAKHFGSTAAVSDLTLSIAPGTVYGLIGPNGAGKTTTFSLICGYLRPDSGELRVLGHRPGDVAALNGRVSALPQDALLPANDSVGDAVAFFARLTGMSRPQAVEASQKALDRVGMGQWLRVRCGALSHGMAKRVGLAQAFLGTPELVLLDEPTAGLDPKSAFQLREFIKEQRRGGQTIVISSHNLHELEELCDAAAVLDRGRLITAGSMKELTLSVAEVRFLLASEPPLDEVKSLPEATAVRFDASRRVLTVVFSPERAEAEDVIARVLKVLLERGVKISAVSKGRKLEERLMELV